MMYHWTVNMHAVSPLSKAEFQRQGTVRNFHVPKVIIVNELKSLFQFICMKSWTTENGLTYNEDENEINKIHMNFSWLWRELQGRR